MATLATTCDLLRTLDLEYPALSEMPLNELASLERTELLSKLKAVGVDKLGARQKIANGLGKALREGSLVLERSPAPAAPPVPLPKPPLVPSPAPAPVDATPRILAARLSTSSPPQMPLVYNLSLPAKPPSTPPPLLLLLHGSGADENDLQPLAPSLSEACAGAVVASLRAPYEQLGGAAWFHGNSRVPPALALEEQIGKSADTVVAFIEAAPEKLGTDPDRALLFGFSQGATVGWTMAMMKWPRPDLLCGMALLSGRAMPELLQPSTPLGARLVSRGELGKRARIFAAHGDLDETTPVALGQQSAALGRKAGLAIEYMEHEGGHSLPEDALKEARKLLKGQLAKALAAKTTSSLPASSGLPLPPKPIAPPPPKPLPTAPATKSRPSSADGSAGQGGFKKNVDYSKWENFDDDEEAERDRERERRKQERIARGELTPMEQYELERDGKAPPKAKQPSQAEQMQEQMQGFDPAAHQKDRIAHLEAMKAMKGPGTERMDHVEMHNEHTMRDAKQQGRQGNIFFGEDGKVVIKSDEDMGSSTAKYAWGQNNTEVTIKCTVPAGTKSRDVQLATTSNSLKLAVRGEAICNGKTHAPILSDESTFSLEDAADGRLLTVTLIKREETRASGHWSCAIKGEGKVDTSKFGVPVTTVNPHDPAALKDVLNNMND